MKASTKMSLKRQMLLRELIHQQWGKCVDCGRKLELKDASVEHVIPRALGGTNARENLAALHRPCNWKRGKELQAFLTGQSTEYKPRIKLVI